MMKFAALIAAAGTSTRMGSPKALLNYGATTLLGHSAEQLQTVTGMRVLATLPPALLLQVSLPCVEILHNRFPDEGYFGSIRSALDTLSTDTIAGLFIMPVDSPLTDRALVFAMAMLAKLPTTKIIVPYHRNQPGHPIFIARHFFAALQQFPGRGGLRQFIAQQRSHVHTLMWPSRAILANLNHPSDVCSFFMKPGCKNGDAAAMDAPERNCSTPSLRNTISSAPSTPIRSISST